MDENTVSFSEIKRETAYVLSFISTGKELTEEHFYELIKNKNELQRSLLVIKLLSALPETVEELSGDNAAQALIKNHEIYKLLSPLSAGSEQLSLIYGLCREAVKTVSLHRKSDAEITCDRVTEIIENEFGDQKLSLTRVGARLGLTHGHLSTLIKKTLGRNFKSLLTERRMTEAYSLLMNTNLKIFEIAEKCGYSDQHYFSHGFKKYHGFSPQILRQTHKNKPHEF